MKCAGCVNAVSGALQQMEGITSVEVDLTSGMVSFQADEPETLITKVSDKLSTIGYPMAVGSMNKH